MSESRNDRIYAMRENGATFREVGDAFGISGARARQIYRREKHRIEGCGCLGWGTEALFGGWPPRIYGHVSYCLYCGKEEEDA